MHPTLSKVHVTQMSISSQQVQLKHEHLLALQELFNIKLFNKTLLSRLNVMRSNIHTHEPTHRCIYMCIKSGFGYQTCWINLTRCRQHLYLKTLIGCQTEGQTGNLWGYIIQQTGASICWRRAGPQADWDLRRWKDSLKKHTQQPPTCSHSSH